MTTTPVPKPRKGESQADFHSRCMSDDTMQKEFPDQAQRNAVCYRTWREREHVQERKIRTMFPFFPFKVTESLRGKALKITGIAMKTGRSRNQNYYPEDIVRDFGKALVGAPIYGEHISAYDAIGKVTDTWFSQPDGLLYYEGEIWDEDFASKIEKGLIRHVSPAADYQSFEVVNGRMPVGIPENAELSLVAVAGMPESNIKVMERLEAQAQSRANKKPKDRKPDEDAKPFTIPLSISIDGKNFFEWLEARFQPIEARLGIKAPVSEAEKKKFRKLVLGKE